MERITLITINYNRLPFTRTLVESLLRNTSLPLNLVLVDNNSREEGTREYLENLEEKHGNITVHLSREEDSGPAEGSNIGLRYAETEYIGLINNDILVPKNPHWLETLLEHLQNREVGLVGCKLLYPNNQIQFAGSYLAKDAFSTLNSLLHRGRFEEASRYSTVERTCHIPSALVLARREEFGRLDETYGRGYYEDTDKCMEYLSRDLNLIYDGRIPLYHYEGATLLTRDQKESHKLFLRNTETFRERWMKTIWRDLERRPTLWGWTDRDLQRARGEMERRGVLLTRTKRIPLREWVRE